MRLTLVLDCNRPDRLTRFWSRALGYQLLFSEEPYSVLGPETGDGPELILQRVPEAKTVKNRMHLDLDVPDFEAESKRLEELGATRVSRDPFDEGGFRWHVMADPEGNEFCVITKTLARA